MRVLSEQASAQFAALPELGMGFQFISDEVSQRALLLNCRYVVAFDELTNPGVWRDLHELNQHDVGSSQADLQPGFGESPAHWMEGLTLDNDRSSFVRAVEAAFGPVRIDSVRFGSPLHQSPPFSGHSTVQSSGFCRFSAFRNDSRRAPGGYHPGTYATSAGDAAIAENGAAAVGRYSLPNPMPAIYRTDFFVGPGAP